MEGGDAPRGHPRAPVTLFPRKDWTTTGTPDAGRSAVLSGSLTVAGQRSHVRRTREVSRGQVIVGGLVYPIASTPHSQVNHPTPPAMTPVAIASHDKGFTPGVIVRGQQNTLARTRSLPLLRAGGHCAGVP